MWALPHSREVKHIVFYQGSGSNDEGWWFLKCDEFLYVIGHDMLYTCVFLSTVYIRFLDPYPSVSDQKKQTNEMNIILHWNKGIIKIKKRLWKPPGEGGSQLLKVKSLIIYDMTCDTWYNVMCCHMVWYMMWYDMMWYEIMWYMIWSTGILQRDHY